MLKLAKYKEQRKFFVHFQKIIIKGNVCATFQLHTTCRCGKSFPFSMICLEAAIRFCQKLRWEGENGKILLNDAESKQNAWNHNRTKTSQQLEPNNHSRSLYFRILHIKGAFSDMRHFLATNSPLKLIKNAFYFTLKTFFFSRFLNFCLDFLIMQKNGLIRKIRLISKLLMSKIAKQTIAMHILPNISRSKDNQAMKTGQIRKYR